MAEKTDLTTSALIIKDNKLLLVHHAKLDKWLFPGGHLEENETPDDSVIREIKEETGLDIELVKTEQFRKDNEDNIITELALPFYANVHSVGDHNHVCLFYLCKTNNENVSNTHESKGYKWVSRDELISSDDISGEIKKIGKLAFEKMDS